MSESATAVDPHAEISHEQDGRVLTGVGVSTEQLAETMDRHSEPVAEPETPADPAAAPVTRGRRRYSELTAERDEANAKAAAAEKKAADLEARLSQPAPQAPQTQPAAPVQTHAPAKFEFPNYETFVAQVNPAASYDDWQDAKDEARYQWRVQNDLDQRLTARIESQRAQQTFQQALDAVKDRGRKAYADYDALMTSGPGALIPIATTQDEAMRRFQFILQHPQSEHVQYAIVKDAAIPTRLQAMNPFEFALEIAKLAPAPTAAPVTPQTPAPPAPYTPVGSSSATVAPSSSDLAGSGNYEAYRSRRATERGVKPKYR